MTPRYKIQIITPNENLLGTIKVGYGDLHNSLTKIQSIFSERRITTALKEDAGMITEIDLKVDKADKRKQIYIQKLIDQVNWAVDNGEIL